MTFGLLAAVSLVTFLVPTSALAAGSGSNDARLNRIEAHLKKSETGQELVKRALKTRGPLADWVKFGNLSRTDAVLTRHLNLQTGEEVRERQVVIELKSEQADDDILLDLAHELTHATIDPAWDPYDPRLKAKDYIRYSIEESGGEIDALMQECKVASELALEAFEYRCGRYVVENELARPGNGHLSRERMKQDFYRVGDWLSKLSHEVKDLKGLPLSTDRPELLSSTGKAPYPVSLYREYEALTASACQNSMKRLRTLASRDRSPASGREPRLQDKTALFVKSRCKLPE